MVSMIFLYIVTKVKLSAWILILSFTFVYVLLQSQTAECLYGFLCHQNQVLITEPGSESGATLPYSKILPISYYKKHIVLPIVLATYALYLLLEHPT